jgi:protein arginine N-methyltransferase 1
LGDLEEHRRYVTDTVRVAAYREAFRASLLHGQVVADLGCGTGILGLLALKAGARHVHFIEQADTIELARESVRRAGFAAQASFYRARSQDVRLTESVDLIVSDHVGYFGIDYGLLDLMSDARERFLRHGGSAMPKTLRLSAALAGSPRCDLLARGWERLPVPSEMQWISRYSQNTKHSLQFEAGELMGPPVEFASMDVTSGSESSLQWEFAMRASRAGAVDGICGWFAAELAPRVWMTNSPLAQQRIDRPQAFLPLDRRIEVVAGEEVHVQLTIRPSDQVIAWRAQTPSHKGSWQSTWHGELLSADDLQRAEPQHVPRLHDEGTATLKALLLCDGIRTRQQVEREATETLRNQFSSADAARNFVQRVLRRHTR